MRPRDFIRYIQVCADSDARLGKTHIDPETVRREDKSFSNYLRNEIEDEIHGLLPDIKAILDTLANLRKTEFKGDEFRAVYSAALDKGSVTTKDPKFVLQVLFHFSVIGNRPRQKLLQFFRYSNKEARFNVNENIIVHRGLYISANNMKNDRTPASRQSCRFQRAEWRSACDPRTTPCGAGLRRQFPCRGRAWLGPLATQAAAASVRSSAPCLSRRKPVSQPMRAALRAFSGEVGTGSPQKMRPLKDNKSEFRSNGIGNSLRPVGSALSGPPLFEMPAQIVDRGKAEFSEVRLSKSAFVPATYKIRTKSAKSRGLEKDGRRERISGLSRALAVQSFVCEGPCLLGIFARPQPDRECLADLRQLGAGCGA